MPYTQKETLSALRTALATVPPPKGKAAFLRRYARPHPSTPALIWRQLCYLRLRVWLAAGLALLAAVWVADAWPSQLLRVCGAVMPFLAVTLVTESRRSYTYGMAELEMAAAFPLHSILLARMALLGALHTGALTVLALAVHKAARGTAALYRLPWPRVALDLLLPYLLTTVLGLALTRRMGTDATWPCLGAALAVLAAWQCLPDLPGPLVHLLAADRSCLAAAAVLLALLGWQLYACLKKTEELPCN